MASGSPGLTPESAPNAGLAPPKPPLLDDHQRGRAHRGDVLRVRRAASAREPAEHGLLVGFCEAFVLAVPTLPN